MNDLFARIYYINLAHRTDRRDHMEKQLEREGIKAERFGAISGDHVSGEFPLKKAIIGCMLSHRTIISAASADDIETVLILEDDAMLATGASLKLREAMKWVPDDWDMLYLGASHPQDREKPVQVNNFWWRLRHAFTTHAYAVRKNAYREIIDQLSGPNWQDQPVDCHYTDIQKRLNCYIINPPIAQQMEGYSDIEGRNMSYGWIGKSL